VNFWKLGGLRNPKTSPPSYGPGNVTYSFDKRDKGMQYNNEVKSAM